MKKLALSLLLSCALAPMHAQNVAVNADGAAPAASALLDVDATALPAGAKKGVLVPRIALTATNAAAPVVAPATSLLVYNTATSGAAPNNVTPGYYYWDGVQWLRFMAGPDAWRLTGNTLVGTEFMGSVNAQPVRFFANGIERMRINPVDGEVIVNGTTSGLAGDALCAIGSAVLPWAVNGYTSFNGGATYGQVRPGTVTLFGAVQGEYYGAGNGANGGTGVRGLYVGTSAVIDRNGVHGQCTSPAATNGGAGVWGQHTIAAGNQHMGVYGSYNGSSYGIGVMGLGFGGGIPAGNFDFGVVGWVGNNFNYSGYFNGNHVVANGTKTASVGTSKGNQLLYVTESPEVWFEDVGTARLLNGEVTVELDPLFLETVHVDEQHPMHVFVQLQGDCKGVFVEPGTTGFRVKELQGGTSSATFSYRVMAKRVHFQDHRFGNDPVWGPGDTRAYMEYAPPPRIDHDENVLLQAARRKDWKPAPMPAGSIAFDELQRQAGKAASR
ncbi:MAG: hypothetical protein IPL52_06900 [Flavobacteriales bacterium]|nr:hypothetical protein [Flavobacteriales bacterium]